MSNDIFEKVKAFAIKQAFIGDELLSRTTSIGDYLDVTGDDAIDFIVAFGKEFNVDVSNFKTADYFDGEPDLFGHLIGTFFYKLFNKWQNPPNTKKHLTLGHLEKAVIAGKLDESIINAS